MGNLKIRIKMTEKMLLYTISKKGLGRYLGKYQENNKDEISKYAFHIQVCVTSEKKYFVGLFKNPLYSKFSDNLEECLYEGDNYSEAKNIFDKIIQDDQNIKSKFIHKIFSKN